MTKEDLIKGFIDEIRLEFKDENWDYLDFIKERYLDSMQSQIVDEIDTSKVTRLEVINHNENEKKYPLGRALVSFRDDNKVYFNLQDSGRTFKIFIEKK